MRGEEGDSRSRFVDCRRHGGGRNRDKSMLAPYKVTRVEVNCRRLTMISSGILLTAVVILFVPRITSGGPR